MSDADFQRLLASVSMLVLAQLVTLDAAIRQRITSPPAPPAAAQPVPEPELPVAEPSPVAPPVNWTIQTIEAHFSSAPRCPHCQSASIKKWGTANGLKRYRCKDCKVTFNALTNTPLAQLHHRELWVEHAAAVADGIALRNVAKRLEVDLTTAFRWRHRFLEAIKAIQPKRLEGTVEADETFFLFSEKGSHHLDRDARKRGGKAEKRGLSEEQIPVLIARDRTKATADRILDDRSEKSIAGLLGPLVARDAILVTANLC